MSETDITEINSLISSIGEMKKLNDELNRKYVDEKILAFVKNVVADYKDNKRKLLKIINDNQHLVFNLDCIHIGDRFCFGIREGESVGISIGCGVSVQARLYGISNFRSGNCGGYDVTCTRVEVFDIGYHTSDTKDERYKTCSAWDLVEHAYDEVAKMPYSEPKTAKGWQTLYNLSTWTRAKNSLLVRQFKEALVGIMDAKASAAKTKERSRLYVNSLNLSYVKVDL